MKIFAVSDRVVNRVYRSDLAKSYPDVDLVVGCGDLPFYYLDFLTSALDVPLLYVLGNHDRGPQYTYDGRELTQVQGGTDIHKRIVNQGGLWFCGLAGSMRYLPAAPLMYSEREMQLEVLGLLPRLLLNRLRFGRGVDVMLTHSPPLGIHDKTDLAHRGFKVFLWLIRLARPRYWLHGHVHLYRRQRSPVTRYLDTTIINVYPTHYLDTSLPEGFNSTRGASINHVDSRPHP